MSNLLQEIEAQITGAKTATAKQNVGIVREIGDAHGFDRLRAAALA